MASNSRHLHLRLTLAGKTRTDTFEGKEYLVVPVVALVEGVIQAVNAPTPELVLAEEFSFAADAWNGRPVMFDHPVINGEQVSANSPDILAKSGIGLIFNTKASATQLEMEAWLDTTKIAELGGDVADVETRIKAGETLEVSVGTFVKTESKSGVKNGKTYEGIWRNIVPDHLAFLPVGATGACSVAMGCGASRAAAYITTAEGYREVKDAIEPMKKRSLRERLMALLPMREAGMSQDDIRNELREALKSAEPLYQYIEDVWESDGYIIYSVWSAVEGGTLSFDVYGYPVDPYTTKMYQRDFTMTEEGGVTLAETRVEVETVISFEPVTATGTEPRATQSCEHCGGSATTQHGGSMDKKERIAALMAHSHNPIKEEAALKALTDDGFKALEASCKKAKEAEEARLAAAASDTRTADEKKKDELLKTLKTCTQKVYSEDELKALKVDELQKVADLVTAASQTPSEPQLVSEEDWLKSAPENVRSMVVRFQTAEQKQKDELIASLKTAQKVYSEDELKKLTVEELQKIATLSNVETTPVDFSARASARAPDTDDVYSKPPDGYAMALDKAAGEVK